MIHPVPTHTRHTAVVRYLTEQDGKTHEVHFAQWTAQQAFEAAWKFMQPRRRLSRRLRVLGNRLGCAGIPRPRLHRLPPSRDVAPRGADTVKDYHRAVRVARRVLVARRYMAKGYGLSEAGRAASVEAVELDLLLWRTLGMDYSEMCLTFRMLHATTDMLT